MRQFISYPKSGRTWIRYILSHLDCETLVDFHHDEFEFNDPGKPPLEFDLAKRLTRYGADEKIVYLDRDPRDVMVSLYHQVTGRFGDFFGYSGTISDFIRDDYFGAKNLQRFRTMWRQILECRGFMHIRYEHCHTDIFGVIASTLSYLQIDVAQSDLEKAIARGSFAEMSAVEETGQFPHPWMRRRNNSPKVRRGIVGGFKTALDESDIHYLDEIFKI